jgi:hypothetical protein
MTHGTQRHSVVATYDTYIGAEAAIIALEQEGLDMSRLSIIGKDFHTEQHALAFYTSGGRMKFWGANGTFWGSLWGILDESAIFYIPGVGPLVVMGPLVGWIVAALESAMVGSGAGALAAALSHIGIPKASVVKYECDVKSGKFLVLAHGNSDMIEQARLVFATTEASELAAHAA